MQAMNSEPLSLGLTGISVKPIVLQSRPHSLNPTLRMSDRQKQQQVSQTATDTSKISITSTPSTISVKSSKSVGGIARKGSANFTSRVIFRAKTKPIEIIEEGSASESAPQKQIVSARNHRLSSTQASFDSQRSTDLMSINSSSSNSGLVDLTEASNRIILPPIKESTVRPGLPKVPQPQPDLFVGISCFQPAKNKENIVKKRNFDFLERTKVKHISEETDTIKLTRYFRSKFSSLITGAGKKQYYLSFLKQMKDLASKIKNYEKIAKQTQTTEETLNKLKKLVATRAKYRYHERIDFERALVMRTLGYESRFIIQQIKDNVAQEKTDEYEDLEDEGDKNATAETDKQGRKDLISPEIIANWKKMRGFPPTQKVFVFCGQYNDMKAQLRSLGWVENPNPESLVFDLKWVTKRKDVDKDLLLEQQITNHFQKNHNLTSKNGIAANLRNLIWYDDVDIDTFYPRCFDLSDVQDFEDFLEEFKFTRAESILKNFLATPEEEKTSLNKFQRCQVLLACASIKRKTANINQKIAMIATNRMPVVKPQEWLLLNSPDGNCELLQEDPEQFLALSQTVTRELDSDETNAVNLTGVCKKYLERCKEQDPQYDLNQNNLWIVKPAGLSRGRGIRAFDKIEPLINYIIGKDVQWVAQKYMENPMTINKKKFDIRQWVIVTEWNPLTIYFYDSCYIRICFEEYNPADLGNKFAHLANNCISKNAENFEERIDDTMMYLEDFVDYIKEQEKGKDMFNEKIKKQMMEIAINSIKSCKDSIEHRRNTLELYGYDFMVDESYNTWLLEINSSPSMEYSTAVTTKLVKMCLEDTANLIHEHYIESDKRFRKETEYGLWKNIYREIK